jgi:hypothetical protein
MPDVHIATADPLGIGTLDGSTEINVTELSGGNVKEFHEVLAGNGRHIQAAVKELRPNEEWSIAYELLDGAAFSLAFGVPVNTDYLITSFSASCGPDSRPTVNVTAIKPSAAGKIKSYAGGGAITIAMSGGFGIVEKWGATSTGAFLSSSCNISMQTLEAMEETSGDFLDAGIYHYGFKKEVSVEAYAAITPPANSKVTDAPTRESREGWKVFASSFWLYMDAIT